MSPSRAVPSAVPAATTAVTATGTAGTTRPAQARAGPLPAARRTAHDSSSPATNTAYGVVRPPPEAMPTAIASSPQVTASMVPATAIASRPVGVCCRPRSSRMPASTGTAVTAREIASISTSTPAGASPCRAGSPLCSTQRANSAPQAIGSSAEPAAVHSRARPDCRPAVPLRISWTAFTRNSASPRCPTVSSSRHPSTSCGQGPKAAASSPPASRHAMISPTIPGCRSSRAARRPSSVAGTTTASVRTVGPYAFARHFGTRAPIVLATSGHPADIHALLGRRHPGPRLTVLGDRDPGRPVSQGHLRQLCGLDDPGLWQLATTLTGTPKEIPA